MDEDVLLFLAVVFAVFFHIIFSDKSNSESRKAKKSKVVKSPPQKNKQAKPTKQIKIIDKVRFPHSDQSLWEAKRNDDGYQLDKKIALIKSLFEKNEKISFVYLGLVDGKKTKKVYTVNLLSIYWKYDKSVGEGNTHKLNYLEGRYQDEFLKLKVSNFLINDIWLSSTTHSKVSEKPFEEPKRFIYTKKVGKRVKKEFCEMCDKNLTDHDISFLNIFIKRIEDPAFNGFGSTLNAEYLPKKIDGYCWTCFAYTHKIDLAICNTCESIIPEKRFLLGHHECISCVEKKEQSEGYKRKVQDIQ